MKINLPVTGQEKSYPDHAKVISTTTPKGAIDSVNQDFLDVTGFSEDELLGENHNVVRHPDMPPAAFDDLWKTVQSGRPWMGIVKNRCKSGDHYWVDAFVTPVYKDGEVTGYQSVRVKPDRSYVSRAEKLYKRLNAGKSISGWMSRLGVVSRLTLGFGLLMAGVVALVGWMAGLSVEMLTGSALLAAGLCYPLAIFMARPWVKAAAVARQVFDNSVAQKIYAGGNDETAQVLTALLAQKAMLRTVLVRLDDAFDVLQDIAKISVDFAHETGRDTESQQQDIEQVAAATQSMAAMVQQMADAATDSVKKTEQVETEVLRGNEVMASATRRVNDLADAVSRATDVIHGVRVDSGKIGSVVDVIRDISEQTNLLALNAAIEAARAGEQGRGFAVVADEVRTLASRTQDSTEEIRTMIERLQKGIENAVSAMDEGRGKVDESVQGTVAAGESLVKVAAAVQDVSEISAQVSEAAMEQINVAADVNQSIKHMTQVTQGTVKGAAEAVVCSQDLVQAADKLGMLIKQFEQR